MASKKNLNLPHDGEEIVVIEYSRRRPHAVVTKKQWQRAGQSGESKAYYDVEWTRYFGLLYYHNSGAGPYDPAHNLHRLINGRHEIWTAPGVLFTKTVKRNGQWVEMPAKELDLAKLGYRRLKQPRLLTGPFGEKSRNPFEVAQEGVTVYCPRCDDYLPDDANVTACGHLEWCDDCAEFIDRESRESAGEPRFVCEHAGAG